MTLLKTMAVFALASGINTASVALELRSHFFTRRLGSRAWYVHLAIISPGWLLFLYLLSVLGASKGWPLPERFRSAGIVALALSLTLWLWAFAYLGSQRTANGNIFGHGPTGPLSDGPFRLLENPMYHSYFLAFVGLALWKANAQYLLLAAESYLLLNVAEARVENRPIRRTP